MKRVRKEERNSEKLQVLLGSTADSFAVGSASTENVSSHGLRVRTGRPWEQDTVLMVLSSERELWARATVVYCQALSDNTFAIGLELLARTGARITL
jgi:PilZ domain